MPRNVIANDGEQRFEALLFDQPGENTFEYGESTYALLASMDGGTTEWVEVPDAVETPEEPTHTVLCRECGHMEKTDDGEDKLVDYKANECTHESNAELLAQIHSVKTGHDPDVVRA